MADLLRDQLQTSLGASYTLERELGGGGMSRVFLAEDGALGRRVVVKVLAPELAEGLSAERFTREIRLAAGLQQANIVPVLSAGTSDGGLPYYTMPLVEGETLRARLARGVVPLAEAAGILRDVLRALAYAHARGIVHRDVKPENVLLSGGVAVVTDFGIAKALQAAKTVAPGGPADALTALTQAGMSLGTPAYMAPEQAAGDPNTDHRADLYAWGVMAYELLAGRHPFADKASPQALIVAHLAETPAPLPPAVARGLAALVERCLAKQPAERPASAEAVLAALDAARDEAVRAAGMPTRAVVARTLGLYALAVVAVAVGTPRVMDALGLPDWVLPAALALIALGLPLLLAALWFRHHAHETGQAQARRHFGLRRVAWGGVAAFTAFALLVAGVMVLRALGIGPAGSLFAAGTLAARDTLVVADFRVTGGDTALGPVVAEAVRADLGQSNAIRVATQSRVAAVIRRMERDPSAQVTDAVAREVAQREGMKAVVAGELTPLGAGYLITLRLLGARSGDVLASFRESADAPGELIPAVGRLTRALRGKIGESLSAVRADPPLSEVTTASLAALRKATAAKHAGNVEMDYVKAAALYREAIALDSSFAGAYGGVAIALGNLYIDPIGRDSALTRAYRYRDRLSERERLFTITQYFEGPGADRRQADAAYQALVALDTTNLNVLNNYGVFLQNLREFARSESVLRRVIRQVTTPSSSFNVINVFLAQGRYAAAESTLAVARTRWPDAEAFMQMDVTSALDARQLDSGVARGERALATLTDSGLRGSVSELLAIAAATRGQPALAERRLAEWRASRRATGDPEAPVTDAVSLARVDLWTRSAPGRATARLDAALAAHPLASHATVEDVRAAFDAAAVYAAAGAAAKAQALFAAAESALDSSARRRLAPERARARAELALAAGNGAEAFRLFRASDVAGDGLPSTTCSTCVFADLARAAERAGWTDSARVYWTRFAEEPAVDRNGTDRWHLARAYRRLGELWAERGDMARAAQYEERYVALRAQAEPELRPELDTVRARLASRRWLARPAEGAGRR